MGKKQTQVPGTERTEIEDLTNAAELYRKTVTERMNLQLVEKDQKAHLLREVKRHIDEGAITLNDKKTDEPQVVYRYEDEDGKVRDVKFAYGKESIKVNLAVTASGEDD